MYRAKSRVSLFNSIPQNEFQVDRYTVGNNYVFKAGLQISRYLESNTSAVSNSAHSKQAGYKNSNLLRGNE